MIQKTNEEIWAAEQLMASAAESVEASKRSRSLRPQATTDLVVYRRKRRSKNRAARKARRANR